MPNQPNQPNPGKNNNSSPFWAFVTLVVATALWGAFAVADRDYTAWVTWEHIRTLAFIPDVFTLVVDGVAWGLIFGLLAAGVSLLIQHGGPFAGTMLGQINAKAQIAARTKPDGKIRPLDPPLPALPPKLTLSDVLKTLAVTASFWALWFGLREYVNFATFAKMHTLTAWPDAVSSVLSAMVYSWPRGVLTFAMPILARWVPTSVLAFLGPILDGLLAGARVATTAARATRRAIRGDGREIHITNEFTEAYLKQCSPRIQEAIVEAALETYIKTHPQIPHTVNEAFR